MRKTSALVRTPAPNFSDGATSGKLGVPDYKLALEQHTNYCKRLEECGLEVAILQPDSNFPDSCFVEDTAVVLNGCTVITNPGHPNRTGETKSIAQVLSSKTKLLQIESPGCLDGGDIMRIDNHLYIGLSDRTNEAGATQLSNFAKSVNMTASFVAVGDQLHLKSGVTAINSTTIVCVQELANNEAFRNISSKIVVPVNEAHAANCLNINGKIIMPTDCPITQTSLEHLGYVVLPVCLTEFNKMDGMITCLSLIF